MFTDPSSPTEVSAEIRFNSLPEKGFCRVWQILGDRKRGIAPLLPISRSTWYAGCLSGRFPAPVKLGKRTTAWKVEDIRRVLADFENATTV